MTPEEALQRAVAKPVAACAKGLAQLLDRCIRHVIEELADQGSLGLDPAGATVPAEGPRPRIALLPLQCPPANGSHWLH